MSIIGGQKSWKNVHFVGIGGIGMSALARWFLAQKWAVSGSDIAPSPFLGELRKEGIKVQIGHKKSHIRPQIGLIIQSQAIKSDNAEMKEAKRLRIPVLSYPEAVGILTEKYRTIAVAGAHGKSTTTALVGLILKNAGLDPTIIIGTKLKELGNKNFRCGKSGYLVLEADEFGRAFLNYSPTFTIVTNIDREHLDVYKNLANVKKAFLKFIGRTKIHGALILNRDSKNLFSLKSEVKKIAKRRKLKVIWYSMNQPAAQKISRRIKIPGRHNVSNALAAYSLAKLFGVPDKKIFKVFSSYNGAWRRMEYRGKLKMRNSKLKVDVFDDYAHHPTEIKATLQAFREKFPNRKIICVFQPHQALRLKLLFKDFVSAFGAADAVIFLPAYRVVGRDEHTFRIDSEKLTLAVRKKNPEKPVFYLANPDTLKEGLRDIIVDKLNFSRSPIIVMMGAGNIVTYTDKLLKKQ